ncbi:MAG TPA: sigma-70 family RNA polymerase sigma factor [Candidatus Methylacidiphilales bacterium]|nr:sigma-70 family RNA polymerase sigma factor [Candidatus Methylacidiphilales bacterium]
MTTTLAATALSDKVVKGGGMEPRESTPKESGVITDRVLVERTQGGDPTAFDELVRRYQPRLLGMLYNMTNNQTDAWDLAMETFEKAYKSIHTFRLDSEFFTWLYRIGFNLTVNFLKRNKHRHNLSMDDEDLDLQNRNEFIDASVSGDAERQARLSELKNKLNESMMKLSDQHRAVVTLFDIQGLSHAEISKILGCKEETVRSRLFYAHKQLQKYLKNYL